MTSQEKANTRLIILAGPSCVGKSPLAKALAKFQPELSKNMQPLVLYNSREPRPGETEGVDYYFRPRKYLEDLKENHHFIKMEVRGDMQALDLKELSQSLNYGNVFFEGNPFIGKLLLTQPLLADVKKLSVFMSPLTRKEILKYKSAKQHRSLSDFIKDLMYGKLLRRTEKQKGKLSGEDYKEIERRASSAFTELQDAYLFQYIIPNHDGEDSDNWNDDQYPKSDAGLALDAFIALLKGKSAPGVEHWNEDLIPR